MIEGEEKERVRELLAQSGAVAVGFAAAGRISDARASKFRKWIADGGNAGMDYMARHAALRDDTANVLADARTVMVMAFSYAPPVLRDASLPRISAYALFPDYHDTVRKLLGPALDRLRADFPEETFRLCVDSAPVDERYWALEAGIGIKGRNGSIIVDNAGCYNFLVEILTTLPVAPDAPSRRLCRGCGACARACPTGALSDDGVIDCRRCLSYLTIEHRGDWTPEMSLVMQSEEGRATLFGCDRCLAVCPHNRNAVAAALPEFTPRGEMLTLTPQDITSMPESGFAAFFQGSPLKRARRDGLLRNARNSQSPHSSGNQD